MRRYCRALSGAVLFLALAGSAAIAQDYPAKAIKIIVPTGAGGVTDMLPRIFGQKLTETTGQPVIVENRPGGNGAVGGAEVLQAPRDGYTLMMGYHAPNAILPHITNLKFDPTKDFVPIVHIMTVPSVLIVNPSIPAKSLQELIAYAKANPGRLSYASQGVGSSGHMAGELFKQMAGIDIVHVPYRGPAPATNDLIGGQVSMMFDTVTFAAQNIQSGKLRAIAVTVPQRVVSLPDVPTFAEAGLPGLEVSAWFGLVAGAGTPQPVIDFLNREANRIFSMPSVRDPHVAQGSILPLGTAEQFGKFIAAEYEKWGTVTKRAGIRVD